MADSKLHKRFPLLLLNIRTTRRPPPESLCADPPVLGPGSGTVVITCLAFNCDPA